ncbi:hypothetical protein [Rhizohabitans arisaemae]|uniref:hypothetical protein n=1 Tax=Rhizohabitans arisaemae TaxID=2720610 RepID=UPI0024B17ABB|nr:hypothetical protein [Rhizohabitans arisaemae]
MSVVDDGRNVVVVQVGDSKPEIHRDLGLNDCRNLIGRFDEKLTASLKRTEDRIDAIRREVVTDPDLAVEYYLLQRAQSRADDLLSCDLDDFSAEEHEKRVDLYHKLSTVGSVLLYEDANFKGKQKFFTATWPNFKWWPYKFNDKASSAKAWGGNILFEHTWYGGRRLYLVGLPYVAFPDLSVFGFNDLASSYAGIP